MYRLGIDIGGTFTDVTLIEAQTGKRWSIKTPSTPDNPSEGFLNGLYSVAGAANRNPAEFTHVFHGTTVATNAILERRRQTRVGMITTRGFRYVLEIGRHDSGDAYYSWIKPQRPVPPELIHEVRERVDHTGTVREQLSEDDVRAAARALTSEGVEAVAIAFLYSFLDPSHERRAAAIVRDENPDLLVALSSDVLPAFREYERFMATALSAYVMPHVSRYVSHLQERMGAISPRARLYIMKSNGGLTSADSAANQALSLAISGPAGGVVGALGVAKRAGIHNIITVDVGGTSSDIALIRDGHVSMTNDQTMGELPVSIPMVDVQAVGAGGGSLARITSTGVLQVGPQSAGAIPGPVCYGKGGDEPTVTDCQVALGRLPSSLAGDTVTLNREAAVTSITERLGQPLSMAWEEAAEGVVRIAVLNMAAGIRKISVERGYDPATFTLVAFGGAGPLHAVDLAAELGIPSVLIPPSPGVLSTWGLLDTDLRSDYVRTVRDDSPFVLQAALDELQVEANEWISKEQVGSTDVDLAAAMDCRYPHQGAEITVPCPPGVITEESLAVTREAFHTEHLRLNTFNMRHMPVEIVSVRLKVTAHVPRTAPLTAGDGASDLDSAKIGTRQVYFNQWMEAEVFNRTSLPVAAMLGGPAIVEQADTTTVVPPGATAMVDEMGNLRITLEVQK